MFRKGDIRTVVHIEKVRKSDQTFILPRVFEMETFMNNP